MMFLRLMLLIPLLRNTMLLDVGIFPDGSECSGGCEDCQPPDYSDLDELVKLHARAMLHMNKLGWPIGSLHRIRVGKQWVSRQGFRRGHYEQTYEFYFGVTAFPDLLIMRSGAIYGRKTTVLSNDAHHYEMGQLELGRIDSETRRHLVDAFAYILDMVPQPVYISE